MAYTLQNIIDAAEELATGVAGDASASPVIDSEITAYMLYPHALRFCINELVNDKDNLADLMAEILIPIDGTGHGTIPDNVLRDQLKYATIAGDKYASYLPPADYNRYRFDNQMCYFSARGSQFSYSCDVDRDVLLTANFTTVAGSDTVTASSGVLTSALIGKLLVVPQPSTKNVYAAGRIQTVPTSSTLTLYGRAIGSSGTAVEGTVYDTANDLVVRTTGSVGGFQDNNEITGDILLEDNGARLYVASAGWDGIILDVPSLGTALLGTNAPISFGPVTAVVYRPSLRLTTPITPAPPTNLTDPLTISPKLAQSVIVTIAAVLRGEIPLARLMADRA